MRMNVYRRYFRVDEGPLISAAAEAIAINKKAEDDYQKILKEIGAMDTQWYQVKGKLTEIMFEGCPDLHLFKRTKNGWYPKKNNKEAKAIATRFEAVQTVNTSACLKEVGLLHDFPVLFGEGKCYYNVLTILRFEPIVCFVNIPWYDIDPEKLEKYKNTDRKNRQDSNMDYLLWEPTRDMVEVKEWEFLRAIEEYNASIEEKR